MRILLVGRGFSGLTSYLREHGHDYIVLKDKLHAKSPNKRLKRRVLCDFSSRQAVLATVNSIEKKIDGVMTVYENYALATAWISKYLSLPGMPISSVEACTDKFLMRQLFAKAPEKISPGFALVHSTEDLLSFANNHQFPLILKPTNLAKSLLVTKSHNTEELLHNYRRTVDQIEEVYATYAPHRTPRILIEEFLEGSVHSVDAFVDSAGTPYILEQIVDYQTGYDIGFDDNFHYSRLLPTKLSDSDQLAIRHCAKLGVEALGMESSPAHIEIIMTKAGPRIVEIGARNGGYRERMHRLANNIDIIGSALAVATGKKPAITATKSYPCAVLELFPKQPGIFKGLKNEVALRKLESLLAINIKAKPGSFIGKSADGYKMSAVIILYHRDYTQFLRDMSFVNRHVSIQT